MFVPATILAKAEDNAANETESIRQAHSCDSSIFFARRPAIPPGPPAKRHRIWDVPRVLVDVSRDTWSAPQWSLYHDIGYNIPKWLCFIITSATTSRKCYLLPSKKYKARHLPAMQCSSTRSWYVDLLHARVSHMLFRKLGQFHQSQPPKIHDVTLNCGKWLFAWYSVHIDCLQILTGKSRKRSLAKSLMLYSFSTPHTRTLVNEIILK